MVTDISYQLASLLPRDSRLRVLLVSILRLRVMVHELTEAVVAGAFQPPPGFQPPGQGRGFPPPGFGGR